MTLPLRCGTPEQFHALRDLLRAADYTESNICRRLGIASFSDFGDVKTGTKLTAELATPLDVLIRVFLECEPVAQTEIESLLGSAAFPLMRDLGLLCPEPADSTRWIAPVGLYPTRSVYLASDRGGELSSLAEDVVYPALLENTQHFLNSLPATPCRKFLDLGAGTGVAALLAAQNYAEHAWACDITERSVHFAEFNRRLNGLENVTAARGDLYEPVQNQTFDRIVTHPPYVPAAKPERIFRDGGEDGEQIVRRIIEGLPRHLEPGGRFYSLTLLSDREGEPVENRIRRWLGERSGEFDVALIAETAREPADFLGRAMQKGAHRLEELHYWSSVFRKLKVRFLVYGYVVVQRKAEDRAAFTVRVQKGPHSGLAEVEWALDWHTRACQPGSLGTILSAHPSKSPYLHMAVLHRMKDGELVPEEFMLRVPHPFQAECKCQSWIAALVERCDGRTTGLELCNDLKQRGIIHPETSGEEFAEVLRALMSAGFLGSELLVIPQYYT